MSDYENNNYGQQEAPESSDGVYHGDTPYQQDPQLQNPQYQQDSQYQNPQYQNSQYQQNPQYQNPQYQNSQYQNPQYQNPQYRQPAGPLPKPGAVLTFGIMGLAFSILGLIYSLALMAVTTLRYVPGISEYLRYGALAYVIVLLVSVAGLVFGIVGKARGSRYESLGGRPTGVVKAGKGIGLAGFIVGIVATVFSCIALIGIL